MSGSAPDLSTVAAVLDSLNHDGDLALQWVSTAHAGSDATSVDFTFTASLGTTSRGHRLETFFQEEPCK